MPLYQYECKSCGKKNEQMRSVEERNNLMSCKCGGIFRKQFSHVTLVTDTSFGLTGEYDSRVCDNRNDKVQGRKDFQRRCAEKNLVPVDTHTLKDIPSDSRSYAKQRVM